MAMPRDLPAFLNSLGKERSIASRLSKEITNSATAAGKTDGQIRQFPFRTTGLSKNERDRLQTLAFFGQAPPETCCGRKACRDAQTRLEEPEFDLEAASRAFSAALDSLEKNGQLNKGIQDALRSDRLHLDNFGMAGLEETITHYEKILAHFGTIHYKKISDLWEGTKKGKTMGFRSDPNRITQTDFNLVYNYFQKWNEYVNLGVCTTQLYNVEKRFGSFPDEYRYIKMKADAVVGGKTEEPLPTMRQKFNDPMGFTETKLFKKDKVKSQKLVPITQVLAEQKRLCTNIIRDIKAINLLVPDHEVRPPCIPTELRYDGSQLPTVPKKVRQALDDLNFLYKEFENSCADISSSQDTVRYVLMTWAATSQIAWKYGKQHIQQFPLLREYEYKRTSLWAEYIVAARSECKILEYFQSGKYQQGTNPKFEAALGVDRTAADVEEEWKKRWQKLELAYRAVPELVQEVQDLVNNMQNHWTKVEKEFAKVIGLSRNSFHPLTELWDDLLTTFSKDII